MPARDIQKLSCNKYHVYCLVFYLPLILGNLFHPRGFVLLKISLFLFFHRLLPCLAYESDIIYGADERIEVFEASDQQMRILGDSVAAVVPGKYFFHDSKSPNYRLFPHGRTVSKTYRVCSSERFALQTSLSICSSFLVAPRLMITAGHCFQSINDCKHLRFVFGYVKGVTQIPIENIYFCKKLLSVKTPEESWGKKDYAIIELDRKVLNRKPLVLVKKSGLDFDDGVFMISHPLGLPMKIAENAFVKDSSSKFFFADLDAFSGDSGAPVFNTKTLEVEGILVDGSEDFEMTPYGCKKVLISHTDEIRGEKILKLSKISGLKKLIKNNYLED